MDKVLKRRLIGASILIALAVIFVPMLLVDPDAVDGGPGDFVDIPPRPESSREVRRIPLNPEAARVAEPARRAAGRDPAPDEADEAEAERATERTADRTANRPRPDESIVLRPDLAEQPLPEQRDKPADERASGEGESPPATQPETDDGSPQSGAESESAATDSSPGDWVVQVASFASRESSEQVRKRLEALGHIVERDEIVRGESLLYRLRTGPYASREAAEQALEQIAATVAGVEPIVRQLDREPRSGVVAGFAVQVGSFIGQDNAEAETARLKGLDFEAFRFSEDVGERRIWRVMVGPVEDRAAADALKARLVGEAGVEGLVVSY